MLINNKQKGDYGEQLAVEYLKSHGYKILELKFRCKFGEIDIVAMQNECIVFVEVKYRKNLDYGLPRESVNFKKQSKIKKTADFYLYRYHKYNIDLRFDVIEIIDINGVKIEHLENAFC